MRWWRCRSATGEQVDVQLFELSGPFCWRYLARYSIVRSTVLQQLDALWTTEMVRIGMDSAK